MLPVVPARGDPCTTQACSACCHDTEMLLTEDDVARLVAAGADPNGWGPASDGFIQLRVRRTGGGPEPCWFLADGRCSVYDARPEGCRLYPAIEGRPVALDDDCPHNESFVLDDATREAVQALVARLHAERRARRRGSKRS